MSDRREEMAAASWFPPRGRRRRRRGGGKFLRAKRPTDAGAPDIIKMDTRQQIEPVSGTRVPRDCDPECGSADAPQVSPSRIEPAHYLIALIHHRSARYYGLGNLWFSFSRLFVFFFFFVMNDPITGRCPG